MRFRYQHVDELAGHGVEIFGCVVDEHAAVYLCGLRLHAPLPQEVCLLGLSLEEHAHGRTDARTVQLSRNPSLLFHQTRTPPLGHLLFDLVRQLKGWRALFILIGENADALKLRVANEGEQLLEIFFRLAGKARDKGRANTDAGHAAANPFD